MPMRAVDLLDAGGVHPVGERIAFWLKPYSAKELARMFGVEPRTAKGWRVGCLPQMRHLTQMAERWGIAFLEDVFAPVLAEPDISVARRLERIEREVSLLKRQVSDDQSDRAAVGAGSHPGGGMERSAGQVVASARPKVSRRVVSAITVAALIAGLLTPDDAWAQLRRSERARPPVVRLAPVKGGRP